MWFLFFQIWVWLLVAFVLGWVAHWFFCCRGGPDNQQKAESPAIVPLVSEVAPESSSDKGIANVTEDGKPMLFASAPDTIDDLKRIKGVGQVLEQTLHDLGVYHYSQIADWNDEQVTWMDNFLSFTGRIDREDWRGQAKILASGGATEFAQRVKDGDVDY